MSITNNNIFKVKNLFPGFDEIEVEKSIEEFLSTGFDENKVEKSIAEFRFTALSNSEIFVDQLLAAPSMNMDTEELDLIFFADLRRAAAIQSSADPNDPNSFTNSKSSCGNPKVLQVKASGILMILILLLIQVELRQFKILQFKLRRQEHNYAIRLPSTPGAKAQLPRELKLLPEDSQLSLDIMTEVNSTKNKRLRPPFSTRGLRTSSTEDCDIHLLEDLELPLHIITGDKLYEKQKLHLCLEEFKLQFLTPEDSKISRDIMTETSSLSRGVQTSISTRGFQNFKGYNDRDSVPTSTPGEIQTPIRYNCKDFAPVQEAALDLTRTRPMPSASTYNHGDNSYDEEKPLKKLKTMEERDTEIEYDYKDFVPIQEIALDLTNAVIIPSTSTYNYEGVFRQEHNFAFTLPSTPKSVASNSSRGLRTTAPYNYGDKLYENKNPGTTSTTGEIKTPTIHNYISKFNENISFRANNLFPNEEYVTLNTLTEAFRNKLRYYPESYSLRAIASFVEHLDHERNNLPNSTHSGASQTRNNSRDKKRPKRYRPRRKGPAVVVQQVPTTRCDYEDNIRHAQDAVQNKTPTGTLQTTTRFDYQDNIRHAQGAVQNKTPTGTLQTTTRFDCQDNIRHAQGAVQNATPTGTLQTATRFDCQDIIPHAQDAVHNSTPTGTLQTTTRFDCQDNLHDEDDHLSNATPTIPLDSIKIESLSDEECDLSTPITTGASQTATSCKNEDNLHDEDEHLSNATPTIPLDSTKKDNLHDEDDHLSNATPTIPLDSIKIEPLSDEECDLPTPITTRASQTATSCKYEGSKTSDFPLQKKPFLDEECTVSKPANYWIFTKQQQAVNTKIICVTKNSLLKTMEESDTESEPDHEDNLCDEEKPLKTMEESDTESEPDCEDNLCDEEKPLKTMEESDTESEPDCEDNLCDEEKPLKTMEESDTESEPDCEDNLCDEEKPLKTMEESDTESEPDCEDNLCDEEKPLKTMEESDIESEPDCEDNLCDEEKPLKTMEESDTESEPDCEDNLCDEEKPLKTMEESDTESEPDCEDNLCDEEKPLKTMEESDTEIEPDCEDNLCDEEKPLKTMEESDTESEPDCEDNLCDEEKPLKTMEESDIESEPDCEDNLCDEERPLKKLRTMEESDTEIAYDYKDHLFPESLGALIDAFRNTLRYYPQADVSYDQDHVPNSNPGIFCHKQGAECSSTNTGAFQAAKIHDYQDDDKQQSNTTPACPLEAIKEDNLHAEQNLVSSSSPSILKTKPKTIYEGNLSHDQDHKPNPSQ
ncbi:hypothetical protein CEXT_409161, partial [Caerostris extrusa]